MILHTLTKAILMGVFLTGAQSAIAANIQSINLVGDSFGDGTRLTKVVIHYDSMINGSSLANGSFEIAGQTITRSYTSSDNLGEHPATNGAYVVLDVDSSARNALIYSTNPQLSTQVLKGNRPSGERPMQKPDDSAGGHHPMQFKAPAIGQFQVTLTQQQAIKENSGALVKPNHLTYRASHVEQISAKRFVTRVFHDPVTGKSLTYNLYIPKDYDATRTYPMVFFGHDAGATSSDPRVTLWQGLGATVWSEPANQARHASFVLAPQFDTQIVDDTNQHSDAMDISARLIKSLEREYSIDRNRVYATGQSGGCMLSIAMNIEYPELFAASYLVAGQWNPTQVTPLVHKPLWIVVSQGDTKAYPGMNAITQTLQQQGSTLTSAVWSGTASAQEIAANAKAMLATDADIHYVALKKGSVVPVNQTEDSGSNHLNTWRIAYTYQPVIDWLYQQKMTHQHGPDLPFSQLVVAAKSGDQQAQSRLGENYFRGHGAEQNNQEAFHWLSLASEQGNAHAKSLLVQLYWQGLGTDKNETKAWALFSEATQQGDMKAPRYLGWFYQQGIAVPADQKKAAEFYQLAANRGDITGQYYLGGMYLKGLGVKQDLRLARYWFNESAARGDLVAAPAMVALADMLDKGLGGELDKAQAKSLLQAAAKVGYEPAQNALKLQ